MNVNDFISVFENLYPKSLAEEWDNVGLMVGRGDKEVQKVMLCLDVTTKVIEECKKENIDLIVSHHPFIFKGIKNITDKDFKGQSILEAIRNDISVISLHTNLDAAKDGVNDVLAKTIKLEKISHWGNEAKGEGTSFGKIGDLEQEMKWEAFLSQVKTNLSLNHIRCVGRRDLVKKVAVFSGSFDGDLKALKASGADVLLTGDLKYHTAMDALEEGLCLIDAGHFGSEIIVLKQLEKVINENFKEIDVFISQNERDPFVLA
jgi:GTP cyclohydrolase I